MAIQNYILIVESALLLVLSLYILFRNPRERIVQSFFIMVFGASIWVIGNAIDYVIKSSFLTKVDYLGAIMIAIGFVFLSFYFPYSIFKTRKWVNIVIICIGIVLTISLFVGNTFFKKIQFYQNYTEIIPGATFHLFNVYFILLWLYAIINFIKKFRNATGLHYWQLKNLFWAIIFSLIAGVTTNLVMPWMGIWTYGWIGPMFSIIFFGFTTYILFKKEVA